MVNVQPKPTDPRFKDLTGQRFGAWAVLRFDCQKSWASYWLCRCECGVERFVNGAALRARRSTSCGHDARLTHGHARKHAKSKTYKIWSAMLQGCHNRKHNKPYNDRDIGVCKDWRKFELFLAWVKRTFPDGKVPDNMTLNRRKRGKDYSPKNCVWVMRGRT